MFDCDRWRDDRGESRALPRQFDLAGARSGEAKFPDLNAVEEDEEDIGGFGFELASRPFKGEPLWL